MSKSRFQFAKQVVQVVVFGSEMSAKFPVLNTAGGRARGSGFFIRMGNEKVPRIIVTGSHVIEDGYLEGGVKVILPLHGQQEIPARVVAIVPEIDLALLEIDPTGKEQYIDALEIGNDHDVTFDGTDFITILGYPLGQDQLKVLRCNFSGRQDVALQTDCAVNPGNSGGPVVYKNKAVGWVSSGVHPSQAHNVSWAIPINQLRAVMPLIKKGMQEHPDETVVIHAPHAGLMYHNSSQADNSEQCQGVVIQFMSRNSALRDVAQPGDKLCSVEYGGHVYKLDHRGEVAVPWYFSKLPFTQIAAEIPADQDVTFHLWDKDTKQIKSKTVLLTSPNSGGFLLQPLRYEPIEYEMFGGVLVMPFRANHLADFPHLRAALKPSEREDDWLLVTHTVPGSEVFESGVLTPGDLLQRVNDQSVKTLEDFRQALQKPFTTAAKRPGIKFTTRDEANMVLDLEDILSKEDTVSAQNGTKLSSVVPILRQQYRFDTTVAQRLLPVTAPLLEPEVSGVPEPGCSSCSSGVAKGQESIDDSAHEVISPIRGQHIDIIARQIYPPTRQPPFQDQQSPQVVID